MFNWIKRRIIKNEIGAAHIVYTTTRDGLEDSVRRTFILGVYKRYIQRLYLLLLKYC